MKNKAELRLRIASLILLLGSLAGHFVLTFAMYCTGRSTYIGLILLPVRRGHTIPAAV